MGKTEKGAVWLDPKRTSPYEYYQYWINADDRDVGRFLALFTFLPMDEVNRLSSLAGEELREAKEILAVEATKLNHGEDEAFKAREASRALFSREGGVDESSVPTVEIERGRFEEGVPAFVLFADAGLAKTRGEARRLIAQGGGYVNGRRLDAAEEIITTGELRDGALMLRAGKKKHARIKAL
jgi:tyrosyl-tRNA synthetase